MGHHSKSIFSFASIVMAAVGVVMIFGHGYRGQPPAWHAILSKALIVVGVFGTAVVMWMLLRRDRAPDFLRGVMQHPLECSGLCFVPIVETIDGITWLTVVFQNRYSKPCIPTIHLAAQNIAWRLEPIEFAADGAEYGILRRVINIPEGLRGRNIVFQVTGKNHYPYGRGRMLRFRDGVVVGQWNQGALNVVTAVAIASGHIHVARTARIEIMLPSEAQTIDEHKYPDTIQTLWVPSQEAS